MTVDVTLDGSLPVGNAEYVCEAGHEECSTSHDGGPCTHPRWWVA